MERKQQISSRGWSTIHGKSRMEPDSVNIFFALNFVNIFSFIVVCSRKIFESLGFEFAQKETQTLLIPPNTDTSSEEGRKNKERLLRAWVEIGTYVAEYRRRFRKTFSLRLYIRDRELMLTG